MNEAFTANKEDQPKDRRGDSINRPMNLNTDTGSHGTKEDPTRQSSRRWIHRWGSQILIEQDDEEKAAAVEDNSSNSNSGNNSKQQSVSKRRNRPRKLLLRQVLSHHQDQVEKADQVDTRLLGPVVGCAVRSHYDDDDDDDVQLEIDPFEWGGEYVSELLASRPLVTSRPKLVLSNDDKHPPPIEATANTLPLAASNLVPHHVGQALQTDGVAVWSDALSLVQVTAWREALQRAQGLSRHHHGQDASVRTDEIGFVQRQRQRLADQNDNVCQDQTLVSFSEEHSSDFESLADGFDFLEDVVAQVADAFVSNQSPRSTLLRPRLGMVSRYRRRISNHQSQEEGDRYTWHYDNERDEEGYWRNYRSLTALLYLNEADWRDDDGGQLEYMIPREQSASTDAKEIHSLTDTQKHQVIPRGGTVVLFDSRRIQHQVLPARRDRYAMTQWFVSDDLLADSHPPCGPSYRMYQRRGEPQLLFNRRKRARADNDNDHKPLSVCHWKEQYATTTSSNCSTTATENASDPNTPSNFSFSFF